MAPQRINRNGRTGYYESTAEELDGCPSCKTKATPHGRMEVVCSVPLCNDCGDAWLAAVAAGTDRPGATATTRRLAHAIARLVGYLIREHQRRVARAVDAAMARGAVVCRHQLDPKEPCTCGRCLDREAAQELLSRLRAHQDPH